MTSRAEINQYFYQQTLEKLKLENERVEKISAKLSPVLWFVDETNFISLKLKGKVNMNLKKSELYNGKFPSYNSPLRQIFVCVYIELVVEVFTSRGSCPGLDRIFST